MTGAFWILIQERGQLEALLGGRTDSPAVLATALGIAFFLGAAHALTPGHGKAIVAAYLAGSRGRITDAVFLGLVVTVTHTASVFALGLAALYATQHVAVDRIYPWIALLSGALVAAVGGWLLWKRLRGKAHRHGHEHVRPGKASLLSLGISGGLVPCPEAFVVLMISVSLRRIALGLAVLVSFSLGLAVVIVSIGVVMVLAAPAVRKAAGDAPWMRALPVASASVVTLLGLGIVIQAVRELSRT